MYSPDGAHLRELKKKPLLAFDETKPFEPQKQAIKQKLTELLGRMPEKVDLNPTVESTIEYEKFTEHRISFDAEQDVRAVCMLCIPKLGLEKYPLCIALQGHGTGMHVSLGRKLYDSDNPAVGDRDIALQAIERGYAAICLEQRGMGERRTELIKEQKKNDGGKPRCQVTAMQALMLGRTLIGERVWDISRTIDLALTYPEIDGERIMCTGNSGGGTATFYAACMDERIKVAMPSCSVCTFRHSLGVIEHCTCNFIPNIASYLDMGDMAAAIAPRKLVIVYGEQDNIFLKEGVVETFDTVKKIYTAAGVPDNCALAKGDEGHRYYKGPAWEAFDAVTKYGW